MTGMETNDRVALRRDPTWTGTVESVRDGVASVKGDKGWTGRVSVDDLVEAPEDKSWPPADMETK